MRGKTSIAVLAIVTTAFLLNAPSSNAQGFDYSRIGIDAQIDGSVIPGSNGVIVITLEAPFGFTITDLPGVFGIQPAGAVDGVTFGDLEKPAPDRVDEVGGHFEGMTTFRLPFTVVAGAEPGERTVTLGFRLQACDDNSGQCFLPTDPDELQRTVSLQIAAEGGEDQAAGAATSGGGGSLENMFQGSLEGGNFWFALVLAVLAGILTSLTPCVYPMIPITISYVSGKAEGKKKNGFFISLVLVLGIAVTYSVLGVLAAMTGGTFGSYINHPIVQVVLFVVLVAMGFSMLGAFEIAMPASMQQKMNVRKSGYVGALGVGLTIGFVAAPCVAPILVIMLTWIATTQNILLGFILMFFYAVGMGLLFVVVGTFSNAVLPKSGMWMVWLKKIFAFVFFLLAVYYAANIIDAVYPDLHVYLIGFLLLLWGTVIGAFYRLEPEAGWWQILGKSIGLLLVVAGLIVFVTPMVKGLLPAGAFVAGERQESSEVTAGPAWITDFDQGLKMAAEQNKPLLVDVGAEWCVACHELDEFTFSDPAVMAEMERFVLVKVDGTNESDPTYTRVREHFADRGYPIVGLPAVFIHNSDGEIVHTINQFQPPEQVLPKLEEVQ